MWYVDWEIKKKRIDVAISFNDLFWGLLNAICLGLVSMLMKLFGYRRFGKLVTYKQTPRKNTDSQNTESHWT